MDSFKLWNVPLSVLLLVLPGGPNTTAVTQETDQSYGIFQSALWDNLQLLIDERMHLQGEAYNAGAMDSWASCFWWLQSRDSVVC